MYCLRSFLLTQSGLCYAQKALLAVPVPHLSSPQNGFIFLFVSQVTLLHIGEMTPTIPRGFSSRLQVKFTEQISMFYVLLESLVQFVTGGRKAVCLCAKCTHLIALRGLGSD